MVACPKNWTLKQKIQVNEIAIGPRQWAAFSHRFSPISDKEVQAAYSLLPTDIHLILQRSCPVFPESGKLIKDTHTLAYISEAENAFDALKFVMSLNYPGVLQKNMYDQFVSHEQFSKGIKNHVESLEKPFKDCWVLMAKDVLGGYDQAPRSRGKSFVEQVEMVNALALLSGLPYKVPRTVEATSALMHTF